MVRPENSREDLKEIRQKYIHLRLLYYKLLAAQKHVEEKLKSAQEELSLEIDDPKAGTDELIAALKDQVAELRKLNSTKDKFISIIAHDLKSPFSSIIGFCDVLHEKIHLNKLEGLERISDIILHSANNAMDLLRDLMEWALMQTGNIEYKPEKKKISEIVDHVMPFFADDIREKEINFVKNIQEEDTIIADSEMIGVVLRNLVSNAIKFSREGGTIEVAAEHKPEETIISVSDTGIGIKKDKLQDLFRIDKSYRRSGTWKEGGTGLGLIICRDIVAKHGGSIWAESRENEGSTFYFSIPG